MAAQFILVIDEGTTGTRAVIVDRDSRIRASAYSEFTQFHPAPDRVEHDAEEIWQATLAMITKALADGNLAITDIAAIGITNQRATTVVWDRASGDPIAPAIVWQDTRTADYIETIRDAWAAKAYAHTGWALAPVYSSLSLRWILENVPGRSGEGRRRAARLRDDRLVADPPPDGREGPCDRRVERLGHRLVRPYEG